MKLPTIPLSGATYYRFDTDGQMGCQVGDEAEDQETYRYTYEKGELSISSDQMSCSGSVKEREIRPYSGRAGRGPAAAGRPGGSKLKKCLTEREKESII